VPTAYFNSLPKKVQANLAPYLGVMQAAAQRNKIPVDLLISIAAKESGGVNTVGDKSLKDKAYGIYQVRHKDYWLGGADPTDTPAATDGLAKRLGSVLDDCNGDPACVHFKYMSGPGQAYTPENVRRISSKFPHVAPRLAEVHDALGLNGAVITTRDPTAQVVPVVQQPPQPTVAPAPMPAAWYVPDLSGQETDFDYSVAPGAPAQSVEYYDTLHNIFTRNS
jgi:hypothetical protein